MRSKNCLRPDGGRSAALRCWCSWPWPAAPVPARSASTATPNPLTGRLDRPPRRRHRPPRRRVGRCSAGRLGGRRQRDRPGVAGGRRFRILRRRHRPREPARRPSRPASTGSGRCRRRRIRPVRHDGAETPNRPVGAGPGRRRRRPARPGLVAGRQLPGNAGRPRPPGTTTGVTKDTITIGLFYPKTGAYTGLGRNVPVVAQAAVDEAGPINGRRLVLKTYDDGTANASTIQVEEKRAKDETFALLSVGERVQRRPRPPGRPAQGADRSSVTSTRRSPCPSPSPSRVFPFWSRQAAILPGFIKNMLRGGDKKIGIVYEGTSTAIDAKNTFKDKAKELGLNVVFEQPIAQNQSTCANEVVEPAGPRRGTRLHDERARWAGSACSATPVPSATSPSGPASA